MPPLEESPRRKDVSLAPFAILAAPCVAFMAHVPSLNDGFVLDDADLLVANPFVRTLAGLRTILCEDLFMASGQPRHLPYWRPLSGLLNWISWQAFEDSAPAQHALNVFLLGALVTLVVLVLRAHEIPRLPSIAAGVLVAAHPAASDVTAYVQGRQWLLGAVFALIGLALIPRCRSLLALGAVAFASTLLAYFAQEFFVITTLLFAIDAALLRAPKERPLALAVSAGAALAACLVNQGLRVVLGIPAQSIHSLGVGGYVKASTGTLLRLLKDCLWPSDLSLNVTIQAASWAVVVVIGAVVSVACAGLVRWVKSDGQGSGARALTAVSLALLLGAAAIPGALVTVSGYMSDRYAAPALIALAFLIAIGLARAPRPVAASAVAGALALALLPSTWARDADWKDESTLYRSSVESRPDDPQSLIGMSYERIAANDLDGAYPYCVRYRAMAPESDRADFCMGAHAFQHGDVKGAIPYFQTYAASHEALESARRALLAALIAAGRLDEAATQADAWERDFPGAPELDEAKAAVVARRATVPAPAPSP